MRVKCLPVKTPYFNVKQQTELTNVTNNENIKGPQVDPVYSI